MLIEIYFSESSHDLIFPDNMRKELGDRLYGIEGSLMEVLKINKSKMKVIDLALVGLSLEKV